MPSDIKECSLYSFTLRGQKIKTTPKDITARAAAEAAQTAANGKQDALTTAQLAAVNSGVTAAKVAAWDAIEVPTKTSDLTNDSGFITGYIETDPTVPAWAKAVSKPTYTASEVGALPDTTAIPAASSASPQMDGTAAAGTSAKYARADHVHPSDSSKQDALSSAQMDAVNSGITVDDLAVNDASVLCSVTPISPTLSAGSHYATFGNCWYYKIGHKVTVHIGINGLTSNANTTLWRLPAGYRPKSMVSFIGTGSSISNTSRYRIEENGDVKVRSEAAYAVGQIEFDAFN